MSCHLLWGLVALKATSPPFLQNDNWFWREDLDQLQAVVVLGRPESCIVKYGA